MRLIVNPHKIKIIKDEQVNEKELNVSECNFDFSEEITDDFVKEALFTFKGTTYKQIITNNKCSFPSEVLEEKGQIEIGVVAYKVIDETTEIRYNPSPAYFNTLIGSMKEKVENTEEITPTDKEQMEQAINNGLVEIDNALTDLQEKVDSGYFKGEKGDTGETGATGATGPAGQNGINGIDGKDGVIQYTAGNNITIENNVINAEVPTKISDLTDDSNFLESTDLKTVNGNSLVGSGDITISGGSSFGLHTEKYDIFGNKNVTHAYMYDENYGTNADFISNGLDYLEKVYNDVAKNFDTTATRNFIKIVGNDGDGIFNVSIQLDNLASSGTVYGNFVNYSQYRSIKKQIKFNVSLENNVYKISRLQNNSDPVIISLTAQNDITYTPTSNYHPATKKYVDDSIASAITTTLGGSY